MEVFFFFFFLQYIQYRHMYKTVDKGAIESPESVGLPPPGPNDTTQNLPKPSPSDRTG